MRDGERIDNLLVVTFTKAAAAEMRARILKALHDAADQGDLRMAAQALSVERADITTLHAFCGQVCRDFFQAAEVDPTFRMLDGAQADVFKEQALLDAINECYERGSSAFTRASLCFTQNALLEAVQMLHRFLMARPDPWDWLNDAVAMHDVSAEALKESPWMEVLLSRVQMDAQFAVSVYDRLVEFAEHHDMFVLFARDEAEMARAFLRATEQGYDAISAFGNLSFATKPRKTKAMDEADAKAFAAMRDAGKAALKAAEEAFAPLRQLETASAEELDIGLTLAGVAEAVLAFEQRYQGLKREKNVLDFNDLEHFALRALRHTSVSVAMRERYAHVFIDEYQDSSMLQEAILGYITRGDNLFMVGDVKQSIYKFRLAEPALFLEKQHTFSPETGSINRRISLNANFRSQPVLLQGINAVFERVFAGGPMELTYEMDERLVAGREPGDDDAPIELHLLTDQEDDGADAPTADELPPEARMAIRQEAECIADRIIALRAESETSYGLRDMAVLMRSVKGRATEVVEVLRARGIAAWSDMGEDALARPEILVMISLLEIIDNFQLDIPLIAALRGPALGLSDHELTTIRIAQPEGRMADAVLAYAERQDALALALRGFVERVRGWALDAQVLPLDTLLRQLYDETGHYAQSGARPDGEMRQANLRTLAEHAGSYQRAQGSGLGGFIRYLARLKAHEGLAAQELGERDDVVRVMSIHKSKGLQFPVVFVAGLGRHFGAQDARKPLQLHASLGIGMQHVDSELWTRHPSLSQKAVLEKRRQESVAEEARILYVAMTRAKERLIMIGAPRASEIDRWQTQPTPAAGAKGMLDWVAPVAFSQGSWQTHLHAKGQIVASQLHATRAIHQMVAQIDALPAPSASGIVAQRLSWRATLEDVPPLKQSVSSVTRAEAKEGERDETPLTFQALQRRPLFLEARGLNATERGDAVHAFLRAVDLAAQDLEAERRRMVERGILSPEQAKTLPMAKLRHSMAGSLWQRMRAATEIHREWPFNLRVMRGGRRSLLQGIIDCCFIEDGAWVLVDYKTDRAEDTDALKTQYAPQLALYAQALEAITKMPVKERILYLIEQETGYEV